MEHCLSIIGFPDTAPDERTDGNLCVCVCVCVCVTNDTPQSEQYSVADRVLRLSRNVYRQSSPICVCRDLTDVRANTVLSCGSSHSIYRYIYQA